MFTDRKTAGDLLAPKISPHDGALVLGLARGGMALAASIASSRSLSLDVLVIKKIGSPFDPEFAIGAIAPDGVHAIDWPAAHRMGADEEFLKSKIALYNDQVKQQMMRYRKGKKPLDIRGKIIILVDDGAATGATMEAAVLWAKKKGARKIVVAVPVASQEAAKKLKPEVDELVILEIPEDFGSVGKWYEKFDQVSDEEVIELLAVSHQSSAISS